MEAVVVVVNLGVRLARKSARHPADVLHDSAAARDQKGQEQAVEGGKIEAFAEVGAGGEQQDRGVVRPDPVEDRPVQLLARPAFQHGGFETMARAQLGSEGLEVHGPVREHEDAAPPSVRVGDVAPDLPGSILVTGHLSEDRLHWGVFGRVRVGQGLMHDKVPPDEHRCRGILDHRVTDGSELHVEDPPEAVAPPGTPSVGGNRLGARWDRCAGVVAASGRADRSRSFSSLRQAISTIAATERGTLWAPSGRHGSNAFAERFVGTAQVSRTGACPLRDLETARRRNHVRRHAVELPLASDLGISQEVQRHARQVEVPDHLGLTVLNVARWLDP